MSFIGFPSGGTIGIVVSISQFNGTVTGTLLGIFCLAIAIGFGIVSGGTLLMLTKVAFFYAYIIIKFH